MKVDNGCLSHSHNYQTYTMNIFDTTAFKSSRLITRHFSPSFSLWISLMPRRFRYPIYAIFGLVRYTKEIANTFHAYDRQTLLKRFEQETYQAIDDKNSLNPVLHAFQLVVHQYDIESDLIASLFHCVKMNLRHQTYDERGYQKIIYGTGEIVALMCLQVFCEGNPYQYNQLKKAARSLGAAIQKVSFLRDMCTDDEVSKWLCHQDVDMAHFISVSKQTMEQDIRDDFADAYPGILQVPSGARIGVYLAYKYYVQLLKEIESSSVETISQRRVDISDYRKIDLLISTFFRTRINYL